MHSSCQNGKSNKKSNKYSIKHSLQYKIVAQADEQYRKIKLYTKIIKYPNNNKGKMSEQGRCKSLLQKLDIFSYVPVPHTYPISSSKSKIGSIIFISIILGYFIFDFVKFLVDNTPVINLYYENTPNNHQYAMPGLAFSFVYGPSLNITLNDPTYLSFLFETVNTEYANNALTTTKTALALTSNCKPAWLGTYNNAYQNLTCVSTPLKLMNPPLKRLTSMSQRLTVTLCSPNNTANITCRPSTQIAQMMAGGRLLVIVNEQQGFDFQTGKLYQSDYQYEVYQFFLVPGLYNRINVIFYPYSYTTYPTFLTSWTTQNYFIFKTLEPVSLMSNVSIYNPYLAAAITFSIAAELTQMEIHYQTIIQHVSMWGALASLIFTVLALCCLAYNKNKFLKKNPSWKQFDKAMKKKIELEVQNTLARSTDEEETGGISSIRRQVELTHDL